MYIGFITTTSTNINLVSINKRTRINLFGLSSFDALSGNSIQYKLMPDIERGLMFDLSSMCIVYTNITDYSEYMGEN